MGLVSGIVVFFLIWWVALFTVLPFSLQRDETGKPDDPRLKRKVLYTTLLAIVIWLVIYMLIQADVISFREMADTMAQGDKK
ncbi:MAG: DUF1467 family protein [Alphaproteobacteria bacterium]|nr:DUF1467 family protein [Alphaproteobacteria bacterium]